MSCSRVSCADFDERLDAGHQVVAGAHQHGVTVEVAIVVARRGAVGERRVLIFGALRAALDGDFDAVEALLTPTLPPSVVKIGKRDSPACTFGLPGLSVPTTNVPSPISAVSRVTSSRPVTLPSTVRPIELRRLAIGRIAAAQRRGDFVTLPVGAREQFGRNRHDRPRRGRPACAPDWCRSRR